MTSRSAPLVDDSPSPNKNHATSTVVLADNFPASECNDSDP